MPSLTLDTALRLPAPDVEALVQGRSILAMPRSFLDVGKLFALYPTDVSSNLLPVEQQYCSGFLTIAKNTISQLHPEGVIIKAWARCELCQIIDKSESLELLSPLTIWTTEALQQIIAKRSYIFLAYLRVYLLLLPEPLVMSADSQGQFVALPKAISVTDISPILSDTVFSQRRHQLENRIAPIHPELEELQSQVAQIAITNPKAENLNHHIQAFLGWVSNPPKKLADTDLSWIKTINDLATATTGGNYERGTAFEQIVHKSLKFLGFELDPNAKGGAGGMDLYCTKPYPLVGECKAGQGLGAMAVQELIRLGGTHLGTDHFLGAVKLVIGPGEPSKPLLKAAHEWKVSIINPMTLQELVELQATYPGSVNLIELKAYLEAGQIDSKIDEYVQTVKKNIKMRSHIVQLVKKHLETTNFENAGIEGLHGAYVHSNPPQSLQDREMHEILIELSSPLAGYLGRKKGSDWRSDRFYYLRDLVVEK
ncbi:MAG: DUF1802 family protein [Phormidium sp.]